MANPDYIKMIKKSVYTWNKWKDQNLNIRNIDLRYANFENMDIKYIDLSETDLLRVQPSIMEVLLENLKVLNPKFKLSSVRRG